MFLLFYNVLDLEIKILGCAMKEDSAPPRVYEVPETLMFWRCPGVPRHYNAKLRHARLLELAPSEY